MVKYRGVGVQVRTLGAKGRGPGGRLCAIMVKVRGAGLQLRSPRANRVKSSMQRPHPMARRDPMARRLNFSNTEALPLFGVAAPARRNWQPIIRSGDGRLRPA